jgi:hypothetical protein
MSSIVPGVAAAEPSPSHHHSTTRASDEADVENWIIVLTAADVVTAAGAAVVGPGPLKTLKTFAIVYSLVSGYAIRITVGSSWCV